MGKTDFKWLRIWLLGYRYVQARKSRNEARVVEPPLDYTVCDFMTMGLATWGLELVFILTLPSGLATNSYAL